MRTFAVVPRGKSYWVEATSDNGVRKMIIGFRTEEAALRCLKDFQRREERNEAPSPATTKPARHGVGVTCRDVQNCTLSRSGVECSVSLAQ
jgi:hypothetical protein